MPKRDLNKLSPQVYQRIFETHPEGALILDELIRRYAARAKREGGIDAVLETYHRMGARSVVEFIVARINQANGVDDHVSDT